MSGSGRKLIEVSLPLDAINRESAREKSIRHGHPSSLHLWWARRPLAACRAVVFAQLVDDPSAHPDRFPSEEEQRAERRRLFDILERLIVWENAHDEGILREARAEIEASYQGHPPTLLDPFAGGGAIPLEAQRLGVPTAASDLNPVAVLINKALLEIPPKFAGMPPVFPEAASGQLTWPRSTGLSKDVVSYGHWMLEVAKERLAHLYPPAVLLDGSEAPVIAWIWARTVACPNPACRLEMPLVRSWWLGKKRGRETYVIASVHDGRVEFSIGTDPRTAPTKSDDGTVTRSGVVCVGCATSSPLSYVRSEGKAGRVGKRLMAIAAEGARRRIYLAPTPEQEAAADVARPDGAPETELPEAALGFRVQGYGMTKHADLFTPRQLVTLVALSDLVGEVRERVLVDASNAGMSKGLDLADAGEGARAYASAVATYLAMTIDRLADLGNSLCRWEPNAECPRQLFGRQTISMTWDFAEGMPLGESSGSWPVLLAGAARAFGSPAFSSPAARSALVSQADAATRSYEGLAVSTDPPYYDNIGYADLSDFFYVWLRRALAPIFPDLFSTVLTPKVAELVADPFRRGGEAEAETFFEQGFIKVFTQIASQAHSDTPVTLFYAFKQSETDAVGTASTGWQTLLEGLLSAGWEITATWPMRTETGSRLRGQNSNALASSIILALRRRSDSAEAVTRRSFIAALKAELPDALRALQQGSVAPVDLAQASIGPGMAVFTRYRSVVEADGSSMTVRTALALINQVLDEVLTAQEGDLNADSRFAVAWFAQHGWNEGDSGLADQLARAKNTSLDGLERSGIFRARAGKAHLVSFSDLEANWDPATDERISEWEVVVHVAKVLDEAGIDSAAPLLNACGRRIDLDNAKELTYQLFALCEKRGWTQAAIVFNALGSSWMDLLSAGRGGTQASQVSLSFDEDEE